MKFQLLFVVFLLLAFAFASKMMEDKEFDFAEEFEDDEEGEGKYFTCNPKNPQAQNRGTVLYKDEATCKEHCKSHYMKCVVRR